MHHSFKFCFHSVPVSISFPLHILLLLAGIFVYVVLFVDITFQLNLCMQPHSLTLIGHVAIFIFKISFVDFLILSNFQMQSPFPFLVLLFVSLGMYFSIRFAFSTLWAS